MNNKIKVLSYQVKQLHAAKDYGTGEASAESKMLRVGDMWSTYYYRLQIINFKK